MRGDRQADASVIWHEAECGSYDADLVVWEELAGQAAGPILELGCGTGRVAKHLAKREHRVLGLDSKPGYAAALGENAVVGDAREFELATEFDLVLAPMQLAQLFADADERKACLDCVARHLTPGGLAAFAIVEEMPEPTDATPPLPDTREVDGWVYSSLPIETLVVSASIRVRRLRQTVSPAGELSEGIDEIVLQTITATTLEDEARRVGLRPAGRRTIPPTGDHVGSTVVLLEKES
jgi:SAM-dependent methyltransferase